MPDDVQQTVRRAGLLHDIGRVANTVTGIGTFTGTHAGELMGIPATGRTFSLGYICVMRLRDGKLAGIRVQADTGGLMQQLTAPR